MLPVRGLLTSNHADDDPPPAHPTRSPPTHWRVYMHASVAQVLTLIAQSLVGSEEVQQAALQWITNLR